MGAGDQIITGVIGGEKVPRLTLKPNTMCCGEYISSVKQLLNRASFCDSAVSSQFARFIPWFHGAATTSAGVMTNTCPGGDTMSNIGLMYAFFRGSVRVYMAGSGSQGFAQLRCYPTNTVRWVDVGGDCNPISTWDTPGSSRQGLFGTQPVDSMNNVHSFLIPYYNSVRCSLLDFTVLDTMVGQDLSVPIVGVNYKSNSSVTVNMLRSAGEDWQLSYFIGCPPLLVSLV